MANDNHESRMSECLAYAQHNFHIHRGAFPQIDADELEAAVIFGNDGFGSYKVTRELQLLRQALEDEGALECDFAAVEHGSWVMLVRGMDWRTAASVVWDAWMAMVDEMSVDASTSTK